MTSAKLSSQSRLARKRKQSARSVGSSRWAAYSAAGVASALCVPLAEAGVIYSGLLNIEVDNEGRDPASRGGSTSLPLAYHFLAMRLGASASLYFLDSYSRQGSEALGAFKMQVIPRKPGATADIAGSFLSSTQSYAQFYNLGGGENLLTQNFAPSEVFATMAFASKSSPYASIYETGEFTAQGEGFLGFKFDLNMGAGEQLGWVRVNNIRGGPENLFEIVDYAFTDGPVSASSAFIIGSCADDATVEDNPQQCNEPDPGLTGLTYQGSTPPRQVQVPVPGSLGLLAFGAAGLALTRRRKREHAQPGGRE